MDGGKERGGNDEREGRERGRERERAERWREREGGMMGVKEGRYFIYVQAHKHTRATSLTGSSGKVCYLDQLTLPWPTLQQTHALRQAGHLKAHSCPYSTSYTSERVSKTSADYYSSSGLISEEGVHCSLK